MNIRHLYRGINEFNTGYQPRNNLMKDEDGDLLADLHKVSRHLRRCEERHPRI
jgi:hypothetical protein